MIELIKHEPYWSKTKTFMLPLSGIKKNPEFDITTYAKWNDYELCNLELIVKIEYNHKFDLFLDYLKNDILSDKHVMVKECYEYEGFTVFIVDMSNWADDVNHFLQGKYSKFSKAAKVKIQTYNAVEGNMVPISIYGCLFPTQVQKILDNMSPLDYAIKHYVIGDRPEEKDFETAEIWKKSGELCSICNQEKETLVLEMCQDGITIP